MNKIFRIVFNRTTGQWVVASEVAKGRKKASCASAVVGAVALVAGTSFGGPVMAADSGSLQLCVPGTSGYSYGAGQATSATLICSGAGTMAFSLNNQGDANGNNGFSSSTARVTGYQNGLLELKGTAGISMLGTVLMNNNKITGLAAGSLVNGGTDGVNADQLFDSNTAIAAALGTTVNASGFVNAPSYALANANAIGGTSGAATDVGAGFTKVDAALGALNTWQTTVNNGGGIKYFHANSGLADSVATGVESIAVGGGAAAIATGTVAIGQNATSSGYTSISIGQDANASGTADIAIGQRAKQVVGASNSIAIGGDAISSDKSVSIGNGADTSTSSWAVAVGTNAKGTGQWATALGGSAVASGNAATSVGVNSTASGTDAVALGKAANATAINSVALGAGSTTTATLPNAAYNPGSATLSGIASTANGEVSIGSLAKERRLTNLAAGSAPTDAVNVSQLQAEDATVDQLGANTAGRLGGGATYSAATGALSAPSYALTNANTIGGTSGAAADVGAGFAKVDAALGALNTWQTTVNNGGGIKYFRVNSGAADAVATGSDAIAIGGNAIANAPSGLAVGMGAVASGTDGTAVGSRTTASGVNSTALGNQVEAKASGSIAIQGNSANVVAVDVGSTSAVAIGTSSTVTSSVSGVALGEGASVTSASKGIALGSGAAVTAANSVALGAGSTTTSTLGTAAYNPGSATLSGIASTANGEVSIGSSTKERRLTNLAAGSAATDAVNVSQLQAEDATVDAQGTTTAAALGGGATYNATTGAISAPSYALANANTIGGTTGAAADVGAGFAKVDAALGVINTTANKGFNISADAGTTSQNIAPGGTVKYAAGTNATVSRSGDTISYGVVANPTFAGMVTANGGLTVGAGQTVSMGGNVVTNVAAGVATTDAVNKGQLDAVKAVADTASKGWKVRANAATADTIAPDETVTVVDGTNSTASYNSSTNTLKVSVVDAPTFTGMVTANGGLTVGAGKTVNMGGNQVANVGSGIDDTDAVNVSQLKGVAGVIGGGADVAADGSIIAPSFSVGSTTGISTVNGAVNALDDRIDAVAGNPLAFSANSGANVTRKLGDTLAIKGVASTAGTYSGNNIQTVTDPATGAINVQMADAPTFGTVTVNAGGTGKISGVTAGTAATDAVNKGQLDALNTIVTKQGTDTASGLGGGAAYDAATGAVSAPSYALSNANTIGGTTGAATDVGAGFAKVDAALGVINTTANKGFNISADGGATSQNIAPGGTVKYVAGTNATVSRSADTITYGVVDNPTFAGMVTANGGLTVGAGKTIDMGGNKVTNVAAGSAATDAVNKSQLDAVAATAGGAMTFTGNDATAGVVNRTLGQTLAIKGVATTAGAYSGNNIRTVTDPTTGAINVQMAESPKFGAVTVNDAGSGKITGVTDGTVAAGSKDAVNGGQLYGVSNSVAAALGGDSVVNADGSISTPSYTVTNADGTTSQVAGVEGAVTNLDGRVAQNTGDINTINTTIAGMGDSLADAVMYDSATHDKVTFGGAGSTTPVQLTNVKTGDLSSASTDAVNGSQLYATNQAVAQNTTNIAGNTTAISNITTQLNSGTIGLVQQAAAGENLTVGKDTDGAAVDFAGTAGARKLINVADGTVAAGSKDAVNGGQLYGVSNSVAAALGGDSVVNADGSISTPSYTVTNADGTTSQVAGVEGAVTNLDGRVAQNTGDINTINTTIAGMGDSLADAVMYDSATHDKVTFGGAGSTTPVQLTNVKTGDLSSASTDAVNGSQLYATNQAVAQNTTNIAGNTTAISNITTQLNSGTIGLVQQAAAGENLTVGKDTDGAAVDFAGTAGARKLINVADGTVAAGSKDAVNGGQLYGVSNSVAAALGGDSVVNADGSISAPVYNLTDADGNPTTATGVEAAFSQIDGRVAQNTGDINTINTTIAGMGDSLADAVMYDSATHDKVTFGGAGSTTPVTLTNVKAGDLSSASTDAVNGSQLYATNQAVAQNTTNIAGNTTAISNITTQLNSGTIGLVQQAAAGENLTVGKDTDGAAVDFAGTAGARKLINVADGTVAAGSKDAVNGGQLYGVSNSVAAALGGDSVVNADGSISAPVYNLTDADGNPTTATGVEAAFSQIDGRVAQNTGDINTINTTIAGMGDSLADAVMYDSATHDKVTFGGAGSTTPVTLTNVKAGDLSSASTDAVNGSQLYATNQAVAQNTTDIAGNTTAINTINQQLDDGTVGLVQYDDAAGLVTVAKDKAGTAVDFRGTAGARKLKGVAAGGEDEDAVNVAQLKKLADAMGGGSTVNADGSVTGPTYYVTNADGSQSTVTNVGDAITNIDGRTYANTTAITNLSQQISSGTVGLVQQAAPGAKLTVGKDTDGTEVDFADKDGNARKLGNVADGTVAAGSKDAVNGGQLHGVSQSVADALGGGSTVNADGSISAPTYTVTNADGTTSQVTGVEGAVTNLDGRVYQNTTAIAGNTQAITNLTQQISNGEVGLVKQDAATRTITVAKDNDGTSVNFAGTAGDRTLSGVGAGKADNDAVNVSQLKAAGVIDANGQAKAMVAYDSPDKASVTLGGEGATAPVAIHNVADGVADHDAVNVALLTSALRVPTAMSSSRPTPTPTTPSTMSGRAWTRWPAR